MTGFISCSTVSGNSPRMNIAATSIKIGMSRRLFSFMGLSSLGFFPYMTFIRRKMYAVWSTLVNTPMIASQLRFELIAAVNTRYLPTNPPRGRNSSKG